MNPKEYQKVLEACTSLATIASMQNKLNKILTATEDKKLKQLLSVVVKNLEAAHQIAVAKKVVSQKSKANIQSPPFKGLCEYCNSCISSSKPQWQILAEQNGWAPQK